MAMQKADKYLADAEKQANKFDWFGTVKKQNQEDAAEMYAKAAAQYKIIKEYGKAGLCYSKSAQCNMAAENEIEAKGQWREAGKCYRHVDFKKSINAYKNAIQLNLDADRFGQAARLQEEIGDMMAEDDHFEEAIAAYEQSADYYEAENDTGNKNKRLLKVAHMCGRAKQWPKQLKYLKIRPNRAWIIIYCDGKSKNIFSKQCCCKFANWQTKTKNGQAVQVKNAMINTRIYRIFMHLRGSAN